MTITRPETTRTGLLAAGLALTLTLLIAGCGGSDDGDDVATDDTSEDTATGTSSDDTADDGDDTADTDDTDDGSGDGDGSGESGSSDDGSGDDDDGGGTGTMGDAELPGEEWDGFAAAGDLFGVVGVAHDDVLNVRAVPDSGADIVTTLEPTATGVEATGRARMLPSSIWYEVTTGDGDGWVNAAFVAFIGGTDDATAEYRATGSPESFETLVDMADTVADAFINDEEGGTEVVQTVAPTVGDLGEITYDVVGLGDDAVKGYRLHIFAAPDEESLEGFNLMSIERTYLCARGSDGELCT